MTDPDFSEYASMDDFVEDLTHKAGLNEYTKAVLAEAFKALPKLKAGVKSDDGDGLRLIIMRMVKREFWVTEPDTIQAIFKLCYGKPLELTDEN